MSLLLLGSCTGPSSPDGYTPLPSGADTGNEEVDDTEDSAPDPGSICPEQAPRPSRIEPTCLPPDGPLELTQVWDYDVSLYEDCTYCGLSVGPIRDTTGNAEINERDRPYVVVMKRRYGLTALYGADGREYWQSDRFHASYGAPLLVDLGEDATIEIVANSGSDGNAISMTDGYTGELLVSGHELGGIPGAYDSVAAADVTGDGVADVLWGRSIVAADGSLLASGTAAEGSPNHIDYVARESFGVDLDGDGIAELLAGPSAYRGDGSILWSNDELPDGHSVVADFDGDLEPDVLLVSGPEMWGLDAASGETVWGPTELEGNCDGLVASSAAVEDLDNDGLPEFVVPCGNRIAAYRWPGVLLWSTEIEGAAFGASIADMDGDGVPEVASYGGYYVYLLSGGNGAVRWKKDTFGTSSSTPVFADIDLDGAIEMVTMTTDMEQRGHVTAWRATPAGPGHRHVWNSSSYHIADINDDMAIPEVSEPYWLTTNSFRSAGLGERLPDIGLSPQFVDVCELECRWGRVVITATLANSGSEAAPAGITVAVTAGEGGPVVATAVTTEEVPANSVGEALRFEVSLEDLDGRVPALEVDPDASQLQCLTWPDDDVVIWTSAVCGEWG